VTGTPIEANNTRRRGEAEAKHKTGVVIVIAQPADALWPGTSLPTKAIVMR
jgi:hypothetical protein